MLEVLSPGFLTTVQDEGRTGHAREGFPEAGAMDALAFRLANLLCGNPEGAAALECTVLGPEVRATEDTVFAVSGNVRAVCCGKDVAPLFPSYLPAGGTLRVEAVGGMRGYIAFLGGICVREVMGSRSTDLRSHIGGYMGRALASGDCLPLAPQDLSRYPVLVRRALGLCPPAHPFFLPREGPMEVHVIPGPQDSLFTEDAKEAFYGGVYTVLRDSGRMGIRLRGPAVLSSSGTDILTDGLLAGCVQITSSGQPIVMMADHQTTGGYAKIATVIPTDLPLLAQAGEGTALRFVPLSHAEAVSRLSLQKHALDDLRKGMENDAESRSECRPRRELRRLYPRTGRRYPPLRHICQRRLRPPRR